MAAELDQVRDAIRRTRLANERTYLAWWRTGLTTFAVSFGAGRLVPQLSGGPDWAFQLIGVAFALVGVAFVTYGYLRYREVESALSRGEYTSLADRAALIFGGVGALLGVATVVLVLLRPG